MRYLVLLCVSVALIGFSTDGSAQGKRLSVSGKPQDEAFCAALGKEAYLDKKCVSEDPKNFATVKTVYEVDYSFGMARDSEPSVCKKADLSRPLLNYLASKNIPFKENFARHASNSTCSFSFVVERKEDLCSNDGRAVLSLTGLSVKLVEINQRNDWHRKKVQASKICG